LQSGGQSGGQKYIPRYTDKNVDEISSVSRVKSMRTIGGNWKALLSPLERRLLECTLTQVWSRAALRPRCFSLCILMTFMRLSQRVFKALSQQARLPAGSSVTHILYADYYLTLMANDPDAMQTMLNRLHWYAQQV